jgi:hypothetical protein
MLPHTIWPNFNIKNPKLGAYGEIAKKDSNLMRREDLKRHEGSRLVCEEKGKKD